MTHNPLKPLAALAMAGLMSAMPAGAEGVYVTPQIAAQTMTPLTGQRASVARDLPLLGFRDVDVRSLSAVQIAQIHNVIYSGRSNGDTRSLIGGILTPGILQRALNRLTSH